MVSILESARRAPGVAEVSSFITPKIDGLVTNYFEWLGATAYEIHRRGETMHRTDVPVSMIYYGMNLDSLFLRVDFRVGYHDPGLIGDAVIVHFLKPHFKRLVIPMGTTTAGARIVEGEHEETVRAMPAGSVVIEEILELGISWRDIGAEADDRVQFMLSLEKGGRSLSVWPMTGFFEVTVPGPDFEQRMWKV